MSRDVSALVWCRFATSSNWYAVDVSTGADSLRSQKCYVCRRVSGAYPLRFETGNTTDRVRWSGNATRKTSIVDKMISAARSSERWTG